MDTLTSAPVLYTPDDRILRETSSANVPVPEARLSDEQLYFRYEIARTVDEIRMHKWQRVALQFPDEMLIDSARVYQRLARELDFSQNAKQNFQRSAVESFGEDLSKLSVAEKPSAVKLMILGDTSYGSCCVDEVAAEHIDADALVHYGRACMSPTSRIPVLHIFTTAELDHDGVLEAFTQSYTDMSTKVVLTAEAPFAWHVGAIVKLLRGKGYSNVFAAEILHDPSSMIPNRTIPEDVKADAQELQHWHVFHISHPPSALLLTLSSRVKGVLVYSVPGHDTTASSSGSTSEKNTSVLLRRRYALVTSMASVSTWGILINTLSVKNYLHVVEHVKSVISASGKRSYMIVVGKINPAKVANFSEIEGWVVIGCWESSLIDSKDFYKPIITPFELELALARDGERVWTGLWTSDFQMVLDNAAAEEVGAQTDTLASERDGQGGSKQDLDSEEESEPPEFDLRTGRYVSRSRPTRNATNTANEASSNGNSSCHALTRRANGDLISINGVASPAAQFLAERRTWQGLGSDFEIKYEDDEEVGALLQEGRSGIARGYHADDADTMR